MNTICKKSEKVRAGLLLIASPRFKTLGEDLTGGTYHDRKGGEVKEIIYSLQKEIHVTFPGIIYTREEMQQAMDLFIAEKVDFVIAEFLSWAEDFGWVRFLRDMPELPVLFVNPVKEKVTFENTLDENDFIDFLCSGTLVGSLEASGSINRIGRKGIRIVMGSRKEVYDQILRFSKAAKVRNVLKQANFGLLANYNELMWSTYIDPYNFFTRVGPEIKFISYSTLSKEINGITDSQTRIYQNELKAKYKVMNDVDPDLFLESVRASLGIAQLTECLEIDAMVFNDVDPAMFELIGLRPGFYHPSLNSNLSVLVPEADMGAGMITFILKLMSGKHVNFIEPFHIEEAYNTFAGGHAGPNDHTDPNYTENVLITRDVRFAKTKYKYAGAPFAWYRIPAGRKTMAQFIECNNTYKLICTLVDSLEGEHLFASYSHSIFRPLIPVKEFFQKILKIGTTQHFAIVDGDYRFELSALAEIMEFEYHEIT